MSLPAAVDPAERNNRGAGTDVAAVARGGLANLVGAVVSAVVNFGLVLVISRWADPYQAGVFFGITSLFLVLVLAVGWRGALGAAWALPYAAVALAGSWSVRGLVRAAAPATARAQSTFREYWRRRCLAGRPDVG